MKKIFLVLPITLFLILGVFFYLLTIDRNPSEIPSMLMNKDVPKFEADELFHNKKFISINEFGNEVVLVNFFASWCKPCRDEHVFIENFSKKKEVRVIGVNYKDNSDKAIAWLNKVGDPYSNIILDKKGKIAIDWGVYGIPETFIVNSNGIIKYRHVGPITKKVYKKINIIIKENK